jgi:meso-butanediol dehydrogenase/(S,S)-butanediol dehydrogenase/diacetyl reductase
MEIAMTARLAGKVAVITGASRGLGRSLSEAFAAEGAQVAMLARGVETLTEAAGEIGAGAIPIPCDIGDPNSVRAAFAEIVLRCGGVDILINNAAIANPRLIEEADDTLAQREVAANILGPVYCCRSAIASMRQRGGGDIINLTSESVRNPYPYLSLYAATKSALETLSIGLRTELKGSGIRVTVFRSGRVKTSFSADWDPAMTQRARTAARETGYYTFAGEAISPEIPAKSILDLVLMDRRANVDLLELRSI